MVKISVDSECDHLSTLALVRANPLNNPADTYPGNHCRRCLCSPTRYTFSSCLISALAVVDSSCARWPCLPGLASVFYVVSKTKGTCSGSVGEFIFPGETIIQWETGVTRKMPQAPLL